MISHPAVLDPLQKVISQEEMGVLEHGNCSTADLEEEPTASNILTAPFAHAELPGAANDDSVMPAVCMMSTTMLSLRVFYCTIIPKCMSYYYYA